MLAATYTQDGTFAVQEIARPPIARDEILLRVCATSVCGTDVKIIRHGHRKLTPGQRIVLGHEFVGVVQEFGAEVAGFPLGTRVGVVPNAGCGTCDACQRGQSNYCPDYTAFGIDRDGSHTTYVGISQKFISQGNLIPLPDSVSDEEASLLEPLSCVVNGVRVARVELGDTVLVYGAGPMGLLHVMLCRIAGAAKLVVVDPQDDRLQRALQLGCDVVLNPTRVEVAERIRDETNGRGVNVAITACPVAAVQAEAVQLLAPFGRLCLFGGLAKGTAPAPLDTNRIHYHNLLISGSTGGSAEDYRMAVRLVANRRIDLTSVISNVFGLHQLEAGYRLALSGTAAGKITFVDRETDTRLSDS